MDVCFCWYYFCSFLSTTWRDYRFRVSRNIHRHCDCNSLAKFMDEENGTMSKTKDGRAALDFLKARFADEENKRHWDTLDRLIGFAAEAELAALDIHKEYLALRAAYEFKVDQVKELALLYSNLQWRSRNLIRVLSDLETHNLGNSGQAEAWIDSFITEYRNNHVLPEAKAQCTHCGLEYDPRDPKSKKRHEAKEHVYLEDPLTEEEPS